MADDQKTPQGSKVFISYSRKDKDFVRRLNDSLDAGGVDAWVDWEGIPLSSDWMEEITRAIEGADAFLFVISPDSLASKVCAEELALGLKYNKKLVPILYREPEKDTPMHEKLAATNWVYMRPQDDFDKTLPALVDAINTDLAWVRQHTRLLQRALEWEQKKRNAGFLLYGGDLEDAEKWMTEATAKPNRQVLPEQARYIAASRREAVKRQRRTLIGVSLALVVSIFLAILAAVQWNAAVLSENKARANEMLANNNAATAVANEHLAATAQAEAQANEALAKQNEAEARRNETIARAQRKAAEAQLYQSRAGQLETSTLLAVDSLNGAPSFQAEEIIRQNLSILPLPVAAVWQEGRIWNIDISPDGALFVTASGDGTACVWQVADGQPRFCVWHEDIVYDALFTRDGAQIVTASRDGFLKFWDASSGDLVQSFEFGSRIWDLDISPDGRWLAAGRGDERMTVFDLSKPDLVPINITQPGEVYVVRFSPDSVWLAAGMSTGQVRLWQVNTNTSVIGPQHTAEVFAIAFSADSKYLVSGGADNTARLGRVGAGFERTIVRHGDWVEDLAFSPDGKWFVAASDDNRVWVWNAATGEELLRMRHASFVQKVKVSPNGQWIATTGFDQTVRVWDAASGSEVLQGSLDGIGSALQFTPDGRRILVGDRSGNTTIWDVRSLEARVGLMEFPQFLREVLVDPAGQWYIMNSDDQFVWQIPAQALTSSSQASQSGRVLFRAATLTYSMDISPDSNWLLVAEDPDANQAILYNFQNERRALLEHGASVLDVAFNPDSSLAVTAGNDGYIFLWDVASAEFLYAIETGAPARSVDFSPDGIHLAVGTDNQTLILNVSERTVDYTLPQVGLIGALQYSSDGRWLATGSNKGLVYLWDAANHAFDVPKAVFRHNGGMLQFAFSPNSHYLAGGGTDNFAHLWDLTLMQEVARLPHVDQVTGVVFSPDSATLLTASRKVVQLWAVDAIRRAPTSDLTRVACTLLKSNLSQVEWDNLFPDEAYRPICPNLPVGQN
ncbi:MAG: TIR domain-containing protein [Anaerolineales bacterium]